VADASPVVSLGCTCSVGGLSDSSPGPSAASTTNIAIPTPPATTREKAAMRNSREARRLNGRVENGVSFLSS
jgi:hypothetical protein